MPLDIDYKSLDQAIRALCHGETDEIAIMATLSCELHHGHPYCDWTGFYRVVAPELLKVGPYQGGHGCLVIPFGRGCGADRADPECPRCRGLSRSYRLFLFHAVGTGLAGLERQGEAVGGAGSGQQRARCLYQGG